MQEKINDEISKSQNDFISSMMGGVPEIPQVDQKTKKQKVNKNLRKHIKETQSELTLEEAKEHLTEVFSKMNITKKLYIGILDEILKWDLQIPNLTLDLKNAIIKNYNDGILKSIENQKDNIKKYEKQLRGEVYE
jgi:hypothetical protein